MLTYISQAFLLSQNGKKPWKILHCRHDDCNLNLHLFLLISKVNVCMAVHAVFFHIYTCLCIFMSCSGTNSGILFNLSIIPAQIQNHSISVEKHNSPRKVMKYNKPTHFRPSDLAFTLHLESH